MKGQKETAAKRATAIREVIEGIELHISKIGVDNDETVKAALNEDLHQLQSLFG
jgi:hypothetical protein